MKKTSDMKFFNSKRSPQQESDLENCDPNTSQKQQNTSKHPSTIKRVFGSNNMWSSSGAGELSHSTAHDDVETSCFNLGTQKVSKVSHTQQLLSQQELDAYIASKKIEEAIMYLEEFEDIDWVKSSQIISLIDLISKGPIKQLPSHAMALTQILTSKQFLLSKHIIKCLFNVAFKEGPDFAFKIDQQLEDQITNTDKLLNYYLHQQSFLPLILYTHSQHLLQSGRADDCWELLLTKQQSMSEKQEYSREDWDKTVQKVCELLLRNIIDNSVKQKAQSHHMQRIEDILIFGVKPLVNRPNDIFFNKLIDYSFKNKQVLVAENLFQFMIKELKISPTIVTINTLIDQYFKNFFPQKAWEVFESLKTTHTHIKPDNFTYTTLINGLKNNKEGAMDLKRAFSLFEEYKENSQPDQIIYNCLLDACINAGDLNKAYQLLEEMKASPMIQLDEITYNTLIKGCGRKKRLNDAIALFEEMKSMGITPNRISFNSLLDSCVKCNRMNIAWKYYEEMTKVFHITPDNFTYSILVNGIKTNHSNRDELLRAIQLLEEIQEEGSFKADEILYNSLIDACVKFNEIGKSLSLFEEMKRKNIEPSSVTYGILIKAYGKQNELAKAFSIFEQMKQKKVCVNDVTYGCLVDACVKNDRLDMALTLIEQMKQSHIQLNTVLYTTLIKGFAKANQIEEALDIFALMKLNQKTYPNLITYNSLLDGLVKSSRLQDADKLFQEMLVSETTTPDLITFSTLFKGHCKRAEMKKLSQLVEYMARLSIQPDESLLQLIMDACVVQQHYQLGLQIFDQFCQHIPQNIQLLLSCLKLYSQGGRLNQAKPLLQKLLQQLEDNRILQNQRNSLEQTLQVLALNATSHMSLISEIVVRAYKRYEVRIPSENMIPLICSENDSMIEELLLLPYLPCDTLQQIQQFLSIKLQKLVVTYISKYSRVSTRDPFGEQFGKIVQSCIKQEDPKPQLQSQWKDSETVLKEVTSQYQPKVQNNNNCQNNENKNNSNQQQQPTKENNQPSQKNNNPKKQTYQNDLEEYIPKKQPHSQWRPVRKY